MTNTSFSSGFNAGVNLGVLKQRRQEFEEQRRQNLRQQAEANFQEALTKTSELVKSQEPIIFSDTERQVKENAQAVLSQGRSSMFRSMQVVFDQAIKNGLMTPDEAKLKLDQLSLAGKPIDPRFAQQQAAVGKGLIKESEKLGEGRAVASDVIQGNLDEELRRQKELRSTPITQRTEDITETPAPPQISSMFGLPNASIKDMQELGIIIPEDKKVLRELITQGSAYNGLVNSGVSALEVLRRAPDVAAIGGLAEIGENIRSTATALARQANIGIEKINLESSVIQDEVARLAGENRELQSLLKSMAYASAIAKGQTGQGLSDKDIANEIAQIGGDARNPQGMQRALMTFMERNENEYRDRIEFTVGKKPPKTAFSMEADELVKMITDAGGFENLPDQDQMIVRMRKRLLEQREQ